jgi:6,7-dimethyl-8-ribityllumazine synthase
VSRDIDASSEDVLSDWQAAEADGQAEHDGVESESPEAESPEAESLESESRPAGDGVWGASPAEPESEPEATAMPEAEPIEHEAPGPDEELEPELPEPGEAEALAVEPSHEHAAGDLHIPDGYSVLEGDADGSRRAVGVVVARFNGSVTSQLLERALDELEAAGVRREAITVMVVPGAFELPLAATALAKTRRFACIVALGCVVRGETPHFEYVAGEAASGLQLAALETGVPVSFGVLTLDHADQATARIEKGAEAVRTALEMADVFGHLRAAASR